MKYDQFFKHEFVAFIPNVLEEGTIYVSMDFATAAHKCPCGCGKEVITPFSPTDWKLTFDGKSISLYPSIGNWNFECLSHYWIKNNRVIWARKWSKERIDSGRHQDNINKRNYYSKNSSLPEKTINKKDIEGKIHKSEAKNTFWLRLKRWWS